MQAFISLSCCSLETAHAWTLRTSRSWQYLPLVGEFSEPIISSEQWIIYSKQSRQSVTFPWLRSKGGSAAHGWIEVTMLQSPTVLGDPHPRQNQRRHQDRTRRVWGWRHRRHQTGHGGCGDGGTRGTGPSTVGVGMEAPEAPRHRSPARPARPPPRRGPAAPRSLPARPAAGNPAGEAGRSLFPAGGRATMARGRKPGGGRAGTQDAGPGEGREREEGW